MFREMRLKEDNQLPAAQAIAMLKITGKKGTP